MKRTVVYFVDDKDASRRANAKALAKLIDTPDVEVRQLPPFRMFTEYDTILADPALGAFFIDNRMRGGGVVDYDGVELAEYLRSHHVKLPIYILTGFPKDDFTASEYRVEDVLDKEDIEDRNSDKAKTIRARLLRRLGLFTDVLNEREQRFHDLLVKSLRQNLSADEEKELGLLETERMLPQQSKELSDIKAVQAAIAALRSRLKSNELFE